MGRVLTPPLPHLPPPDSPFISYLVSLVLERLARLPNLGPAFQYLAVKDKKKDKLLSLIPQNPRPIKEKILPVLILV